MSDNKVIPAFPSQAHLVGQMMAACEIVMQVAQYLQHEQQLQGHSIVRYAWDVTERNRGLMRAIETGSMQGVKGADHD